MRKFNHKKALEIAWNIVYVASFIALVALGISNANEYGIDTETSQEYYYSNQDCMNCDEID